MSDETNKAIKHMTDRLCEMYLEREGEECKWDRALYDAMIYGQGQVKLFPDKTHGIRVEYIPRAPKKKWWQFWK